MPDERIREGSQSDRSSRQCLSGEATLLSVVSQASSARAGFRLEVNANISRTLDREASPAKHAAGTGCGCFAVSARAWVEGKEEESGRKEREREETYDCGAVCRIIYAANYPSGFNPWTACRGMARTKLEQDCVRAHLARDNAIRKARAFNPAGAQ